MEPFQLILMCVYIAALGAYIFVKSDPKLFALRVIVKMTLAAIYLALAVVNAFYGKGQTFFKVAVIIACAFAFAGDLLLLFKKTFMLGVSCFFLANLTLLSSEAGFISNLALAFGDFALAAVVFLVFFGGLAAMQLTGLISFGKRTVPLNIYIAVSSLSGSLGLALAFKGFGLMSSLLGLGAALFMVSDYIYGAYVYKFKSRVVSAANSVFYFSGMFLVALSSAF